MRGGRCFQHGEGEPRAYATVQLVVQGADAQPLPTAVGIPSLAQPSSNLTPSPSPTHIWATASTPAATEPAVQPERTSVIRLEYSTGIETRLTFLFLFCTASGALLLALLSVSVHIIVNFEAQGTGTRLLTLQSELIANAVLLGFNVLAVAGHCWCGYSAYWRKDQKGGCSAQEGMSMTEPEP